MGWPVGDGTCWVSIGGDSRFILEDLGNVGGLFDVTGESDCLRGVFNMEHIMDAPSMEDVLFCTRGGSGGASSTESSGRS